MWSLISPVITASPIPLVQLPSGVIVSVAYDINAFRSLSLDERIISPHFDPVLPHFLARRKVKMMSKKNGRTCDVVGIYITKKEEVLQYIWFYILHPWQYEELIEVHQI